MIVMSAFEFWFADTIIHSGMFAFLRSADTVGITGIKARVGNYFTRRARFGKLLKLRAAR